MMILELATLMEKLAELEPAEPNRIEQLKIRNELVGAWRRCRADPRVGVFIAEQLEASKGAEVLAEGDEARAECERLRAERDEAQQGGDAAVRDAQTAWEEWRKVAGYTWPPQFDGENE